MQIMHGILALATFLALAWIVSEDRRRPPLRVVFGGVALQIVFTLILLKFPPARSLFLILNDAVAALQSATDAGTTLVFGYLGGGPLPFVETKPGASFILGFRAFPLVLVISALASLLLYLGLLQRIVGVLAFALRHTLGIGGALGLGACVHIFVGMVEAPLLVRPYLKAMSRGELFALMSCGMAGIAGTVMVIYASLLGPVIPDALSHILVASLISTPAALAIAALMVPFKPNPAETGRLAVTDPAANMMDAITRGTNDGIRFLAGIIAMLIVLVALVALVNSALALIPHQGEPVTLQNLLAYAFRPVMWLIGIPWAETGVAAALMGTKTVLNEFVAYIDFARLAPEALSERSRLIMTYALCGFANFGSLGIMVGGMTAMAPERRHDIVDLGMRSILAGTFATCMSGAVVGMIV